MTGIDQIELPQLVTTTQAAELFGVKQYTIREWIKDGKLEAVRLNRSWRIPRQNIIDFINKEHGS